MRILIADDCSKIREVIKKAIRKKIKVDAFYQCSDGQEAVEQYQKQRPDFALMDIMMEPLNGLSASKKIKQIDPQARIIIVTGYNDPEFRQKAKDMKVTAYVLKEDIAEIPALLKGVL